MPRAAKKTSEKAGDNKFIASTVRPGESSAARYRATDASALIARYVGYSYIAASRVSSVLASCRLRLMRPAGSKKGREYAGRRITQAREKQWLRCTLPGRGPGYRAASYAAQASELDEIMEHPVLDLLDDPNPFEQGITLRQMAFTVKQLCGNAYLYVEQGSSGEPVSLWQCEPQFVRVKPDRRGFIAGYTYGREAGIERDFSIDEIIHIKHEQDPQNPYYGRGALKAVLQEHDIYMAINQQQLALFDNLGRPDWVFASKKPLNDTQVKQIRCEIDSLVRGVRRAGNYLVLGGEFDVKPLSFPPKDLQLDQQRTVAETVALAFGVPPSVIHLNDANLASSLTGDVQFMRMTIQPQINIWAATLTEHLLPLYGIEPGEMWFVADNVVPEDEQAKTSILVSLTSAGILTIDEARADCNLAPVPGGDVPRVNGVPLDSLGAQTFDVPESEVDAGAVHANPTFDGSQVAAAVDTLAKVKEGVLSVQAATEILVSFFGLDYSKAESMAKSQVAMNDDSGAADDSDDADADADVYEPADVEPTVDEQEDEETDESEESEETEEVPQRSQASMIRAHALELIGLVRVSGRAETLDEDETIGDQERPIDERFYLTVRRFFNRQRDAYIAAMTAAPRGLQVSGSIKKRGKVDDYMKAWGMDDPEKWAEILREETNPIVIQLIDIGASKGIKEVIEAGGKGVDQLPHFGLSNAAAVKALEEEAEKYRRRLVDVNKTTGMAIKATLAEGLANDEQLPELRDRVREVFDGIGEGGEPMSAIRAAMIARTETAYAENTGKEASWIGSEIVEGKVWVRAPNCCEFCVSAGSRYAKPIQLREPFFRVGDVITGADGGLFSVDYTDVYSPPLHPHDRCTVRPALKGQS